MAVLNTVTVFVIFLAVARSQLVFSNTGKHAPAEEEEDKDVLVPRSLDAWSILYPAQEDGIVQFPNEEQQIARDEAVTAGPSMARSSRDSPSFGVPANHFKPAHKAINPSQHDDFIANKRRRKRHLHPSSSWSLHAHHNPSHTLPHEEFLGEESLWFEEDPLQYPIEEPSHQDFPWHYPEGAIEIPVHEALHEPLVHEFEKRMWINRRLRPKQMRPSHLPDVSQQLSQFARLLANKHKDPTSRELTTPESLSPRFGYVGERCKLSSGAVSKCALITECQSAIQDIKRGVRPVHCGFKGRYEIVCCGDLSDSKPRPDPRPQGGGWNWGGSEVTKPSSPRPPTRPTAKPTAKPVSPLPVRSAVGVKAAKVGERCKLSSGAVSKCALITECQSAIQDIKRGVRPVHCGFKGRYEIVCCGDLSDSKPRPDPRPQGGGWNWGGSEVTKPSSPRPPTRPTAKPTAKPVSPLPVRSAVGVKAAKACKEYRQNEFQRLGPYISGGIEAMLAEFPHMVMLGYPDGSAYRDSTLMNGSRVSWQCGGTLIARHDPFVARVGELDYSDDNDGAEPEDVGIADFILHPEYHPQQWYNDIALIKLTRPVAFSQSVQPACLPEPIVDTSSNTYLADRKLIVSGWGDTEYVMDKASPRLMKADMKSVPLDVCNQSYAGDTGKLPRGISNFGHLCAQDRNGTSADACRGDSGGPLQEPLPVPSPLYKVVGVTAAGKACAGTAPTIYTRVADYVGWIESVVWPAT
ncbi:hypothetical protein B566_EDAN002856 [Ephemera danica]|nr:hypothetical protein B566_EDAN002856 [Ephemera danica]